MSNSDGCSNSVTLYVWQDLMQGTVVGSWLAVNRRLLNGEISVPSAQFDQCTLTIGMVIEGLMKSLGSRAVQGFKVQGYRNAFEATKDLPSSVVILHTKQQGTKGTIVRFAPRAIFCGDGAYVLAGGHGGLGQHIIQWMAHNGAKHLVTLSRSGIRSADAKNTVDQVEKLGVKFQVIQADATKTDELKNALKQVRQCAPILGCMNSAMVLADAALSTMTSEQWDLATHAKVQPAWNLHNAPLGDELDFFILFHPSFRFLFVGISSFTTLPTTAIALSPVTRIGVLANNEELLRSFRVSGLEASIADDLNKTLEAAILESRSLERPVITTGFQMFETIDDEVQVKPERTQIYWTKSPEFGLLMDHKFRERIRYEESSYSVLRRQCFPSD
ncbi:hypothetical protein AJ79_03635 [Helicocarpus griseus UAMH5409]|uniref:Ketoreductase domain-containing protein n=1 Tax=Helicocarpus griseus UAMH5409 TaxID=1447875 RepID=A0A2B7XX43_9EURO|nr:hypothetical protein AJ79_03635 [Helicocarpus griseus UAMH5409]